MSCPGCYKQGTDRFCPKCRQKLFDGLKIPAVLPFDTPKDTNLPQYQEKTKRLSISGVQLKYSIRLEDQVLTLTDKNGAYILKPIPPSRQIAMPAEAPENEHLTMQIAEQVFGIRTAANAFMHFKDGAPAYLTRRFDVIAANGLRYQQEDFAQLSGKTKASHGENYKYNGTCEDIGKLISKFIAAPVPALEEFFRLVLLNYIISNGDAHLKKLAIMRTPYGDYGLTPAYDLMCTIIHSEGESDMALDLYQGDVDHPFYQTHGYLGRPHFEEFAKRIGILPRRANNILQSLLGKKENVYQMINNSHLSDAAKTKYRNYYDDKLRRFYTE